MESLYIILRRVASRNLPTIISHLLKKVNSPGHIFENLDEVFSSVLHSPGGYGLNDIPAGPYEVVDPDIGKTPASSGEVKIAEGGEITPQQFDGMLCSPQKDGVCPGEPPGLCSHDFPGFYEPGFSTSDTTRLASS